MIRHKNVSVNNVLIKPKCAYRKEKAINKLSIIRYAMLSFSRVPLAIEVPILQ